MDVTQLTWAATAGWSDDLPAPDGRETLVLAFGSSDLLYTPTPFLDLIDNWGAERVLGCSTPYSVTNSGRTASLAATVIRFDRTRVSTAHAEIRRAGGTRRAARRLANLVAEPALRGAVAFADGLEVDGSQLGVGWHDVLTDVPLSGALAAHNGQWDVTWTLVNGLPRTGWVSAFGLAGDDVEIATASRGGWEAFSQERVVTRSHGNTLYELNGRPAIEIFQNYVGHSVFGIADAALGFPLAVRDLDGHTAIRSLVGVDERTQGLLFAGDIPQGATARLMCASNDDLIHNAGIAAKQADLGHAQVALACSGSGRGRVLGERLDEEWDAVCAAFTADTTVAGVTTMGELQPHDDGSELNNQTMTITTIRETSPFGP
jgi:hypothetical protein